MTEQLYIFHGAYGAGLRPRHAINPGQTVLALQGEWVKTPTRFTLQIDETRHLLPQSRLWGWINHSCDPNLRVDTREMQFVSLRSIEPEEELTFNYLSTEWAMAEPFQCQCNSADCVGWAAGASLLPVLHHGRFAPLASEFIHRRWSTLQVPSQ